MEGKALANININEKLLKEAQTLGNHKTKEEAVTAALKDYIRKKKQSEIIKMFRKMDYVLEYNYKIQRD